MGLQRVAQPRAASSVRRRQTRAALGRGASTWWAWVLALGVLLWTVPSAALSVPPLQGRVNDHAGMLSAAQRAQLEARLAQFEQSSKHQFALLTVRSLEGDAIEDFSIRVAEAWKLGDAQRDDGLILIIAAQERKVRIEVGYGLEGNIPDAIAGRVIRQVIAPEFRQGRHAQGINNAFELLMKAATGQELPPQAAAQAPRKQTRDLPIFGVLLLLGLLFGWFGRGGGGGAAALWLAANALSGGRGGGGGGGRGYRGGGGGFGGGGASGGW